MCIADKAGQDAGRQVDSKELFATELCGDDRSERHEDVHVDEKMQEAEVAEVCEQHRKRGGPRHRTRGEVARHDGRPLRHAPRRKHGHVHADDADREPLRGVQLVPPGVQSAAEFAGFTEVARVPRPGNRARTGGKQSTRHAVN